MIQKYSKFLLLFVIPLLSIFILFYATPFGNGVTTDTIYYVSAARNLSQGKGLIAINDDGNYEPLWRFPPLTSFLLLFTSAGEMSGFVVINAVCMVLLLTIAGGYIFYKTKKLWLAVIVQILILFSHDILTIHTMGWSESIFLVLQLVGIVSFIEFLQTRRKVFIVTSVVAAGFSMLTRYAGVSFLFFYVTAFAFYEWPLNLKKLMKIGAVVLTASIPFFVWNFYLRFIAHGRSARNFGIHIITPSELTEGFGTVFGWVYPFGVHNSLAGLLLIGGVLALAYAIFKAYLNREEIIKFAKTNIAVSVMGMFSLVYICFIVLTMSFFDELTPLDFRILAPALLSTIMTAILYISTQKIENSLVKMTLFGILGLVIIGGILQVNLQHTKGTVLASKTWKESQTIEYIRKLPKGIKVYTNAVAGVYVLGNYDNATLPFKTKPTMDHNSIYRVEVQSIAEQTKQFSNVYIVYFKPGPYISTWHPEQKELENLLSLQLVKEFPDAIIYQVAPKLEK